MRLVRAPFPRALRTGLRELSLCALLGVVAAAGACIQPQPLPPGLQSDGGVPAAAPMPPDEKGSTTRAPSDSGTDAGAFNAPADAAESIDAGHDADGGSDAGPKADASTDGGGS